MRKILQNLYKISLLKRLIPSLIKLFIRVTKLNNIMIEHNNFIINLNLNNPIDREIYLKNAYEIKQVEFLSKQIHINNFNIFIDIGAHLGFYSLIFSSKNMKVYSFEPVLNNFEQLKKNQEDNKFNNMKIFNIALSDRKKKIKMWVPDKKKTGGFSIYDNNDDEIIKYNRNRIYELECESDLGDSLLNIKDKKIAIKIDVERHEKKVLEGIRKLLDNNKIILQIEIFNQKKNDILKYLNKMKFIHFNTIEKDYYFKNF